MKINMLLENHIDTPYNNQLLIDWDMEPSLYVINDIPFDVTDEQLDNLVELSFTPEEVEIYGTRVMYCFKDEYKADRYHDHMTWKQFVEYAKNDMEDDFKE